MPRHVRSNQHKPASPATGVSGSQRMRLHARLIFTATLVLSAFLCTLSRGEDGGFRAERLSDGVMVTFDGKPVLEYRSAKDAYKPYVSKLHTPSGVQLLVDSPPDHVHHHGLMFGLSVNDVDFWQERSGVDGLPSIGRQRGDDLQCHVESRDEGPQKFVVTQVVDWLGRENRPLVHERRNLTGWHEKSAKCLLLTWSSQLSPADSRESIALRGERYVGLGMRFSQVMPQAGTFLFANDRSAEPKDRNENLIRASWCAYVAQGSGAGATVAMFGNPANRRHPTLWFSMVEPFSYLSATLDLHNHELPLRSEKSFELTYGMAVADGVLGHGEIQRLYQDWLQQD
ncbi:MAG: PmoA family protein [Pirellulales bacterium]|nr:PmoA family protein [Pirellulales bacterium]